MKLENLNVAVAASGWDLKAELSEDKGAGSEARTAAKQSQYMSGHQKMGEAGVNTPLVFSSQTSSVQQAVTYQMP